MNYLSPTEFESYGLEPDTAVAWITAASAIIDAHCRRATLAVAQYDERLRMMPDRNTVRVTYLPLTNVAPATTPIISVMGRYSLPRRGESPLAELSADVSTAFGLPGVWVAMDPASIDFDTHTGELTLPSNALGFGFSEVEIVYTAGVDPLPSAVKSACAQIVRNAQATPALNVRASSLDRMHLEYFSDSLADTTVRSLLAPYVAQKVG
ncbi:MAG TPA: hypothetical protein VH437_06240 [Terriglobales bacterium]